MKKTFFLRLFMAALFIGAFSIYSCKKENDLNVELSTNPDLQKTVKAVSLERAKAYAEKTFSEKTFQSLDWSNNFEVDNEFGNSFLMVYNKTISQGTRKTLTDAPALQYFFYENSAGQVNYNALAQKLDFSSQTGIGVGKIALYNSETDQILEGSPTDTGFEPTVIYAATIARRTGIAAIETWDWWFHGPGSAPTDDGNNPPGGNGGKGDPSGAHVVPPYFPPTPTWNQGASITASTQAQIDYLLHHLPRFTSVDPQLILSQRNYVENYLTTYTAASRQQNNNFFALSNYIAESNLGATMNTVRWMDGTWGRTRMNFSATLPIGTGQALRDQANSITINSLSPVVTTSLATYAPKFRTELFNRTRTMEVQFNAFVNTLPNNLKDFLQGRDLSRGYYMQVSRQVAGYLFDNGRTPTAEQIAVATWHIEKILSDNRYKEDMYGKQWPKIESEAWNAMVFKLYNDIIHIDNSLPVCVRNFFSTINSSDMSFTNIGYTNGVGGIGGLLRWFSNELSISGATVPQVRTTYSLNNINIVASSIALDAFQQDPSILALALTPRITDDNNKIYDVVFRPNIDQYNEILIFASYLHEIIHTFLYNSQFSSCTGGGGHVCEIHSAHGIMSTTFVNTLKKALKEFAKIRHSWPDPLTNDELYEAAAWTGLLDRVDNMGIRAPTPGWRTLLANDPQRAARLRNTLFNLGQLANPLALPRACP